jgi:hypothetical protein
MMRLVCALWIDNSKYGLSDLETDLEAFAGLRSIVRAAARPADSGLHLPYLDYHTGETFLLLIPTGGRPITILPYDPGKAR